MAAIPKKIIAERSLTPPPKVLVPIETVSEEDPVQSALVQHAIAGSTTAMDQLIRDHQAAVRIFLSRYINCSETVDDLAQEVFVVAFRDLAKYRSDSRFSDLAAGNCRFKALSHLRNQMRWRNAISSTSKWRSRGGRFNESKTRSLSMPRKCNRH